MEIHSRNLQRLCRVCTNRLQTAREIRAKKKKIKANDHKDQISILYGIDISFDDSSTHSQYICAVCHSRTYNSQKTGKKKNEMNLDSVYGELKKKMEDNDIWSSHIDGHCTVCSAFMRRAFSVVCSTLPAQNNVS